MPKQEASFTIPGTDVELPPWALLAGGAGVLAALFFMKGDSTPSGTPSGLIGEEVEQRIREAEEGQAQTLADFLREIMEMMEGIGSPADPVVPVPQIPPPPIKIDPPPIIYHLDPVPSVDPNIGPRGTAQHGIKVKLPKQAIVAKEVPPAIRRARGYVTQEEKKAQSIVRSVADIIRRSRVIAIGAMYPSKPKIIPTQPQQPKQGTYY